MIFVESRQHPGQTADHPQPVAYDFVADTWKKTLGGLVTSAIIGPLCLLSAALGGVHGDAATTIATVFGLLFTGFAVLCALNWRKLNRPRKLWFESQGIRYEDTPRKSWAIGWDELRTVAVSRAAHRSRHGIWRYRIRLDFHPRDQGLRQRHPELEPFWEMHDVRGGYRFPLGLSDRATKVADEGMKRFRPDMYAGVQPDHRPMLLN